MAQILRKMKHDYYHLLKRSAFLNIFCNQGVDVHLRKITTDCGPPVEMTYSKFDSISKSGKPPLIIMHGLFGSRTNWKTIGKIINQKTGITVYTVDARNHGDSPHTEEMNYLCLGEDLLHFQETHNLAGATFMGHSMGGRAVMAAALTKPELLNDIIILDISPLGLSESSATFPKFLKVMMEAKIPEEYNISEGRKYLDKLLQPEVPELEVRQFLLTRLVKEDGNFRFTSNLEAISKNFDPHIVEFPEHLLNNSYNGKTTFIGGEKSNYIKKTTHEAIKKIFPSSEFHYVPNAGHWIQAENPQGFLNIVVPILAS